LSRRSLLLGAGIAGLAAFPAVADPFTPGEARFTGLSVDTSPIAERGLTNYAARVAREAQPILTKVFADRLAQGHAGGLRLVLRIDSIGLSSNAGARGLNFLDSNQDSIEGAGVILDAHGKVVHIEPIYTTASAFGPRTGDTLENEDLRMQNLVTILAEWVKRAV